MPAQFYWTGNFGPDATVPANWYSTTLPGPGDNVYIQPGSVDCVGLPGRVTSLYMDPDYTGHVVPKGTLRVGGITLLGGNLDVSEGALISKTLDWRGGTLNSTDTLSTVEMLPGSGANIDSPSGSSTPVSLTLGSTLLFDSGDPDGTPPPQRGGAGGTIQNATINFANVAGITVGSASATSLVAAVTMLETTTLIGDPAGSSLHVIAKASETITGKNAGSANKNMYLWIDGGAVMISGEATPNFDAKVPAAASAQQPNVLMSKGELAMQYGTELRASQMVQIKDGNFYMVAGPNNPNFSVDVTTKLFQVDGGDIWPSWQGGNNVGRLDCSADVVWNGGTYHATVIRNLASNKNSDMWYAGKTFKFGTKDVVVKLNVINPNDPGLFQDPFIIGSGDGLVGNIPGNATDQNGANRNLSPDTNVGPKQLKVKWI